MENSSHKYLPEVDIVRAIAFLIVAIVHVSVPTWTDGIADPGLFERVILSVIKSGWIGVPIFLFISGYSLAIGKTKPGYQLDVKQFFINRVLRLLPLWIACLFILEWSHHLGGGQFLSLLLLRIQDIPPATAFNISKTIQLEFSCYLLFPMLIGYLYNVRQICLVFLTLIAFKIIICGVPTQMAWNFSYATVFGAITIFLTGMLSRAFMESNSPWKAKLRPHAPWMFFVGLALLVGMLHFINLHGGWQQATGRKMTLFFLLFPEMCASLLALTLVSYFLMVAGRTKKLSPLAVIFAHIGTVSYSGYLFSLFVHDFVHAMFIRHLALVQPGGWLPYMAFLAIYLSLLIGFSTLTFLTIEKPFLAKRKKY